MNTIYELPPILRGSAENQLAQLRDYLVRMARQGAESAVTVSPGGAVVPAAQTTVPAQSAEDARRQAAALRALIVKTAERQAADKAALRLELAAEGGALSAHVYRGARELTAPEAAGLGGVVWLDGDGNVTAGGLAPALAADAPLTAQLEKNDAPVTGGPLVFTEAVSRPVRSLTVSLRPTQELNGFARPWPPGGGGNLWRAADNPIEQGAIASATGENSEATGRVRTGGFVEVEPGAVYTLAANGEIDDGFVLEYAADGTYLGLSSGWRALPYSFTAGAETAKLRLVFRFSDNRQISPARLDWLTLVPGSAALPYANVCPLAEHGGVSVSLSPTADAADGAAYSLSFEDGNGTPFTVCGGTVDLISGELTVDSAVLDLGALNYTRAAGGYFTASAPGGAMNLNGQSADDAKCSLYRRVPIDSVTGRAGTEIVDGSFSVGSQRISVSPQIAVRDDRFADAASLKAALAGQKAVYRLAAPFTVRLAPRRLSTLVGENHVSCGAGALSLTAATVLARAEHRPAQRLHVRYSDDGETFTADGGQTVGAWIGTRADFSEQASEVFSDYAWRRFADDRELSGRLGVLESGVGELSHAMRADYVALSDFGAYAQQVTADIDANARAITETHNYAELVSAAAAAGVRGELTEYMSRVDGQIRRGFIADPDEPGSFVYGIAVSRKLRFTGATQTVDGELCWELDGAQTFGLYTSTGWQFWVGGRKIGWFDSADGMLHVTQMAAEQELRLGADWLVTGAGGFGVRWIGG